MARYLLLALNGPTDGDGDEAALDRWYEEVHLPAFKTIPGIQTARRYRVLRGKVPGVELWPRVAAYEIETDDLAAVSAQLAAKLGDFHPALDREKSAHLMAVQIAGDA
ncbi:MAG TPA: hypothetical protein VJM11_02420 [Nevskiaceae bacterium]|nr:hypothetical protein [Nevskiaceae bacterium]